MTVGVLKFDRKLEAVTGPRDRHPETKSNGQTRMSGRESLDPERVPSPAEDEQLAPYSLHRIGEKCNIDTRSDRVRRRIHMASLNPGQFTLTNSQKHLELR